MRSFLDVVKEAGELHQAGEYERASWMYEHLLGAQPDDPVVLYLYGTLKSQVNNYGSAITLLEKATAIEPDELPEAWVNLGVAYRSEGHLDKSRNAYSRALDLEPDNALTWANFAGTFVNAGEPEMALQAADKALAIEPDNAQAKNQKALALLELGRYSEAWQYYDNRFNLNSSSCSLRPFTVPLWKGEKVGKLAITGEQGLGDEILFLSCLEDLRDRADEIVIECSPRLVDLFHRSFRVACYGSYDELIKVHPDVEAHIPMGSLPGLCRGKSEDFPGTPFLEPDRERHNKWRKRLEDMGEGPYIGIAWHGGTKGTHQEVRCPPLEMWEPVVKQPGTFISLQYGEDGKAQAEQLGIPHFDEALDDLDEFAALVSALDVVISVCQTAIHFAGGLGVNCWCLTPSKPAWRYSVTGNMPWYGSVDLIRQDGDDWLGPFIEVQKRLADLRGIPAAKQNAA